MKKQNIVILSVVGVVLLGGVLFFALRPKRKDEEVGGEVEPQPTFPSELPKIDLGKIFSKKEDEQKAKYSLMEKLKISPSVITATKKADKESRFKNVKYPTINVGGVDLPTTNTNMAAINRLNPPKITSSSIKPSKLSGTIGGLGFVK